MPATEVVCTIPGWGLGPLFVCPPPERELGGGKGLSASLHSTGAKTETARPKSYTVLFGCYWLGSCFSWWKSLASRVGQQRCFFFFLYMYPLGINKDKPCALLHVLEFFYHFEKRVSKCCVRTYSYTTTILERTLNFFLISWKFLENVMLNVLVF